jgi:hypothetical protein
LSHESLFNGDSDWQLKAGLNYPGATHELMTEGYLRAAQRLIESLAASPTGTDFLVYPVIYLYRHWFELRLKSIIDQGRQLLEEGSGYRHATTLSQSCSRENQSIG